MPPPENQIIPLSIPGPLNADYVYDWENRTTTETVYQGTTNPLVDTAENIYTWEADVKSGTNILEDRRIISKAVYPDGLYDPANPASNLVTRKDWTYNPDTVMVTTTTDGNGNTNYYTYNSFRQLTKKEYLSMGSNDNEQFTYDPATHDMVTSKDRNGNLLNYIYQNHLVTRVDYQVDNAPYSRLFSYTNGLLTARTDSSGYVVDYTYDPQGQGQLYQKTYNRDVWISGGNVQTQQQTVTWNRDTFGRLLSYTDASGHTVSYAYDSARYLVSKSENVDVNGTIQARTESYSYDIVGNLTNVTDYTGKLTKYAYDADGNITSVSKEDESGQFQIVKSYEHESSGKLVKITDGEGHITEIYRNAAGWRTSVVEKQVTTTEGMKDVTTSYEYDLAGNLTKKSLPQQNGLPGEWTYSYNPLSRLTSVLEPGSPLAASYGYDYNGNLTSFTDPNGNSAGFVYNEISKVTAVTRQGLSPEYYEYDGEGRITKSWDDATIPPTPPGTVYTGGGSNNNDKFCSVGYRKNHNGSNKNMDMAIKVAPAGNLTFDKASIFINKLNKNPTGNWTVSVQTDANDLPSGIYLQREDGSNAIITVNGPTEKEVWHEFDIGNGQTITSNQTFWIVFDAVDQSKKDKYWKLGYGGSSPGLSASRYDGVWYPEDFDIGIELANTIGGGQGQSPESTYLYHPEGTISTVNLADGQIIAYEYDARGNAVYSSRNSSNTLIETESGYNINGLVSYMSQKINGAVKSSSFQYNALGQLTHLEYPLDNQASSFSIDYQYTSDAFHYLKVIPGFINDVQYYGNGRVKLIQFANGMSEATSRDQLGRPTGLSIADTDDPAGNISRFLESYGWNERGNLSAKVRNKFNNAGDIIDTFNEQHDYDENDRLVFSDDNFGSPLRYAYDPAGNRLTDPMDPDQQSGYYGYDSNNQLIRQGFADENHLEFAWEEPYGRLRGNMVTKNLVGSSGQVLSTVATYQWTEDNLLKQVDRPDVASVSYNYDAAGNRVFKSSLNGTVRYLFMGLNVHFEEHSDNSVNYYIHALGRHIARVSVNPQGGQETYFYHADYLGSVRLVTDVTGAVVWSERYRPFGSEVEQSGSIVNDYRFTGKAWDAEAGLFYFNARWYDPEVGRFISEDPLWGNIRDPQSLNRFAYGRNNPFRFTDPTGMVAFNEIGMASMTDGDGNYGTVGPYDGGLFEGDGGGADSVLSGPLSILDLGDPSIGFDPLGLMPVHPFSEKHTHRNRHNSCPATTPTRENSYDSEYHDRFNNDWEKDNVLSAYGLHGGDKGYITFRNAVTKSQCTYDKNGHIVDNDGWTMGTYDYGGYILEHILYDVVPHFINSNYEHGLTTIY